MYRLETPRILQAMSGRQILRRRHTNRQRQTAQSNREPDRVCPDTALPPGKAGRPAKSWKTPWNGYSPPLQRKRRKKVPEPIKKKYSGTSRGFGFVTVEGFDEDFFIPGKETLNAFHGDKVLISTLKHARGPRKEARIIRILSRNTSQLIGVFNQCEGYGFVIPNNKKIADDIYIPGFATGNAVTGSLVIIELTDFGTEKRNPEGKVIEVIGHIDDPGTDILQVIKTYGIPVDFPDDVEHQLDSIPDEVSEEEKTDRRDFRDLDTITIDGEDAKDLDDAISLDYSDGIYHLGVHIADVSHYVREGSPLDKEALNRGTSNYLVDSVIPMLPHKLSNGICSLNHDVDRLTLSCVMDIDGSGKVINHEIVEGLINVNERMNYTDVATILEGEEIHPEIAEEDPSRSYESLMERYKPLILNYDMELRVQRKKRFHRF